MIISTLSAKAIKDSRNQPTIQVSVNGQKASSPSGKSKGKHETPQYYKSLSFCLSFLNKKSNPLLGLKISSFKDLKKIESVLVSSLNLSNPKKFGANSLFSLQTATLKALAKSLNFPLWKIINPLAKKLPTPLGNAIGGGLHSHPPFTPTFQEFLLIPQEKTFKKSVSLLISAHKKLRTILKSKKMNDEGAWQTNLDEQGVLEILSKFKNIKIGIDIAASSFYKFPNYKYGSLKIARKDQISYINALIKKFSIKYMEDPLQEEDFSGFSKISKSSLVTGDDLTATQIPRLKKAIRSKSISALIIKPNQNGSLLELQEIFKICKKNKIKTVLSHRSGETLDSTIADLAFAFQADFIKAGIATKYRRVKLDRLIEIERSLKQKS